MSPWTRNQSPLTMAFMMQAMTKAADNLDFETAIMMRDEINEMKEMIRQRSTRRR